MGRLRYLGLGMFLVINYSVTQDILTKGPVYSTTGVANRTACESTATDHGFFKSLVTFSTKRLEYRSVSRNTESFGSMGSVLL